MRTKISKLSILSCDKETSNDVVIQKLLYWLIDRPSNARREVVHLFSKM